jgi:hypothetical protein
MSQRQEQHNTHVWFWLPWTRVLLLEDTRGKEGSTTQRECGQNHGQKRGGVDVEKVEKELKHLIDSNWQWRVKQLSDKEFLAIFPNKKILETFSRSNGLDLALYKISVTIEASDMDPAVSSLLQTGWVQLANVPKLARNVEAVTAIAELAGEVIAVDEVSLIRDEPIRVKIRAREVSKISGSLEYFVEGVGFFIKFTPEKGLINLHLLRNLHPHMTRRQMMTIWRMMMRTFCMIPMEILVRKVKKMVKGVGHPRRIAEELKITKGKGVVKREDNMRRSG